MWARISRARIFSTTERTILRWQDPSGFDGVGTAMKMIRQSAKSARVIFGGKHFSGSISYIFIGWLLDLRSCVAFPTNPFPIIPNDIYFIQTKFYLRFSEIKKLYYNMKIGIVGLGFVGGAMMRSFEEKGVNVHAKYDKFKNGGIGRIEDLLECDILFSALPTVYNHSIKEYNKLPLYETCEYLSANNYSGVFVVKSTIEPNTCDQLVSKYNLRILHNPEFLTARTAYEDFHNQTHIVLGKTDLITNDEHRKIGEFYQTYYPNAVISYCSATESESMKIFCNSFYSVKIQFFNELYLVCQKNGSDYKKVMDMMLKNGWINPMHTDVPGPDGQLSYGGLCFPKDTNALNEFMKRNDIPHRVLDATIAERNEMRDDKDNCE